MGAIPSNEVVIANSEHRGMLDIPVGASDDAYLGHMNAFADEVMETSGLCNREMFELAFYPRSIRPGARFYPGNVSATARQSFRLANELAFVAGEAIANDDPIAKSHIVDPRRIGIALPAGTQASPAISYEIERIDDAINADEPQYLGMVKLTGLWLPEDGDKEPSERDVSEHVLLELLRPNTRIASLAITSCTELGHMGLLVGTEDVRRHVDIVSTKSYDESMHIFASSLQRLRISGRALGYHIPEIKE